MANELVKLVAKKAGISEMIAQIAVDTVLNSLKAKLPPAIGSTLDSFMGSSSSSSSKTTTTKSTKTTSKTTKKSDNPLGDLGSIAGTIGSLLGKK